MDTTNEKKIIIGIKDILICILVAVLCFNTCSDKNSEVEYKKGNYDSLYLKMKSDSILIIALKEKSYQDSVKITSSQVKTDSLTKIKDKYASLYKSSKKNVLVQISEGVLDTNSVKYLVRDCDSVIMASKNESIQKDTTIKWALNQTSDLKEQLVIANGMLDASRGIIKGQSNDIKALEDKIVKIEKKNKIRTALIIIGDAIKDGLLIFGLTKI